MAVDAIVALPRTFTEIPVAGHSTVRAMLIVAILRAMALSAKLHHFGVRDGFAIREPKRRVAIVRTVAGNASEVAVAAGDMLMKALELVADARVVIRFPVTVAGVAGNGHGLTVRIQEARIDARPSRRLPNMHIFQSRRAALVISLIGRGGTGRIRRSAY